jgi:hypothetical protein
VACSKYDDPQRDLLKPRLLILCHRVRGRVTFTANMLATLGPRVPLHFRHHRRLHRLVVRCIAAGADISTIWTMCQSYGRHYILFPRCSGKQESVASEVEVASLRRDVPSEML